MILPNKYITMSESLIGLSACVLDIIDDNRYTIEQVWDRLNKKYIRTKQHFISNCRIRKSGYWWRRNHRIHFS